MNIEKFTMKTPDGIHENVEALKRLFPEIVSEGKVDFEQLKTILGGEIADDERYQFTWAGKREAMLEASTPTTKTLRPCVEESKDWENTKNLYIEGDNLEALKILQNTYGGKVKMIYIDPPYNTGHDFIYHDNFHGTRQEELIKEGAVDEETGERFKMNSESNGHFHSDWCSMMYPRLKLARNLLADDGLLFISIDDNEANNLKRICDDVFGERNYLNQIAWVVNITGRQISGSGAAKTWESIFVYAKNIDMARVLEVDISFAKKEMPSTYKGFNKDIRTDARGNFAIGDTLYNHNRKFNEETRRNLVYSIFYNPQTEEIVPGDMGEKKDGFVEILPHANGDGVHKYHAWRWSRQKVMAESYNLIALPTSSGGWELYTRIRDFSATTLKDLITNISNGDSEVQALFDGKKYFDYPKSVALLSLLINSVKWQDNVIILDFFSGSATTAHAVMKLNAEDGGNRKFIMVQLPEVCAEGSEAAKAGYKNICEIGKERIRRAGEKIKEELAAKDAKSAKSGDLDTGFRVFKVDSSNMDDIYFQPMEVQQQDLIRAINNVKTDRTALDLLFGCLLEWGLSIDLPVKERKDLGASTYEVDNGRIIAAFDSNITESTVRSIANEQPDFAIFRDQCFYDSASKINVSEIFKTLSSNTKLKVL